jgi:hypothetical protein
MIAVLRLRDETDPFETSMVRGVFMDKLYKQLYQYITDADYNLGDEHARRIESWVGQIRKHIGKWPIDPRGDEGMYV